MAPAASRRREGRGYGREAERGWRAERCAMSRLTLLVCQALVAVVFLGLWQLFATVPVFGRMLLPPFFFSNPVDVGSQIVAWFVSGVIWKHLVITLWESVLAFAIGSLAGVLVGFWFARQPRIAAIFDPYVKMVNALPRVVLAPICTLGP